MKGVNQSNICHELKAANHEAVTAMAEENSVKYKNIDGGITEDEIWNDRLRKEKKKNRNRNENKIEKEHSKVSGFFFF